MLFERLAKLIAEQFGVDEATITMNTGFAEDLGADSLDIVELSMALEEEFNVDEMSEEEITGIATVGDLADYLQSKMDM